jgi:ABC-type dipeptide/oligopeptide/nickel transport system permease subunit
MSLLEVTDRAQGTTAESKTPVRLAWARLRQDKVAVTSIGFIVVVIGFALAAPLFAQWTGHPYDTPFPKTGVDLNGLPAGPGAEFPLGADVLGRDVLVRSAYGARISLGVGISATILATAGGVAVGVGAGFCGGAVDTVLARLMDIVLTFPYLLVAIVLATTFNLQSIFSSLAMTISVIAFFSFSAIGRVVRGQVLSIKEKEYIEAARSLGASRMKIMVVDVLPNLVAPVTVLASLMIPASIVFESTLSFLGVGARAPMPSWGSMLGEGGEVAGTAWWLLAVPGTLLLLTTLAFNLVGDGIRDALARRR